LKKIVAPHGKWISPLELDDLFTRPSPPLYPRAYKDHLYWIEARAKEGGRQVLIRREKDGSEQCLTPDNFNIRTRVHEYGGICFVVANDHVYFSNFEDQGLYRQGLNPGQRPQRLTPAINSDGSLGKYADFSMHPNDQWMCFIYEQDYKDKENKNAIAYLPIDQASEGEPIILVEGGDFYASPLISPNGQYLAWVEWDHPDMPWDNSRVCMAEIAVVNQQPSLINSRIIAGGKGQSVCQLVFGIDNSLYFCKDQQTENNTANNYWNIYAYKENCLHTITQDLAEYGEPHWVFGQSRIVPISPGQLVAVRTSGAGDDLVHIDCDSGSVEVLDSPYNHFSQLAPAYVNPGVTQPAGQPALLMIAASATLEPELVGCDIRNRKFEVLKRYPPPLSGENISCAEEICYLTDRNDQAFAYFYPPKNANYEAPENSLPPLLVLVHGGPTSMAQPNFVAAKQYWTSQGYALLDVNHRGSSGYGRRYRQSLLGNWGEFDTNDIAFGVRQLILEQRVDEARVCIRGGSAGGYAVLRALTQFPDLFAAGACYYGIGNLITLAMTTHKFEAHYLDGLLGELFDPERARLPDSVYMTRSPINYLSKLRSPMILFQGEDDKVVPPEVSHEVVKVLKTLGLDHEYREYPGEAHGFRKSETRVDALTMETAFFSRILEF